MSERATQSWLRRAGTGAVAAGMILGVIGAVSNPAAAAGGNNGTVKIDDLAVDKSAPNANDPQIDCTGLIEWYGFDPGVQDADVVFEVQAPTSNTGAPGAPSSKSYLDVPVDDGDGPGGASLDGTLSYDLSDLLAFYTPHAQGFHLKVTVTTTLAQGSEESFKVFWMDPCPVIPPNPTFGSLSIDKAVDGNDPQDPALLFGFTVDCSDGQPVDLNGASAGNQASFTLTAAQAAHVLSNIPTGAVCTVTETDTQAADATSMTVDGGAPTAGTTVSGIVIGDATTVAVAATNTFDTAAGNPGGGNPGGGNPGGGNPGGGNPGGGNPGGGNPGGGNPGGGNPGGGNPAPVLIPPVEVTPPAVTPPAALPVVLPDVVLAPEAPVVPETPVVSETPAAAPTEVAGIVVTRELPRTGSTTLPLLQVGLGLILLGAGAVLFGRERTALI